MEEKWKRIFASKRYHTKDGVIKLTPLEQQELVDDLQDIEEKLSGNVTPSSIRAERNNIED